MRNSNDFSSNSRKQGQDFSGREILLKTRNLRGPATLSLGFEKAPPMKQHVARVLASAALVGLVALSGTMALAQEKTATQCRDEWRANKADNQAKGITEKAYVAQCRAGGGTAQTAPAAAPAPTPAPPAAGPKTTAAPAPTPARTTGVAPTGANQFASEADAKARCPSDTVVWVNESSKIYHFAGHKNYGHTKVGAYMCERDATAAGNRAAKDEKRS
jgi:hypothetical protein